MAWALDLQLFGVFGKGIDFLGASASILLL